MKHCLFWLSGVIGVAAIMIVLSSAVSLYFAYSNYTLCMLVLGVVVFLAALVLLRYARSHRQ